MELKKLQDGHVAAWNERDPARREVLLKSIYADDITMYDQDVLLHGTGEISDFIQKIQGDPKFFFSAVGNIEGVQDSAKLSGRIRTSDVTLESLDFFILENGKVKQYYAYVRPESQGGIVGAAE